MASFIDRVVLHARGGDGGNGCASVRREKFKPLGGPDGANGGSGGDVILVVDPQTTTLLDFHYAPHQRATHGTQGKGDMRTRSNEVDPEQFVRSGTVVTDDTDSVLPDLEG